MGILALCTYTRQNNLLPHIRMGPGWWWDQHGVCGRDSASHDMTTLFLLLMTVPLGQTLLYHRLDLLPSDIVCLHLKQLATTGKQWSIYSSPKQVEVLVCGEDIIPVMSCLSWHCMSKQCWKATQGFLMISSLVVDHLTQVLIQILQSGILLCIIICLKSVKFCIWELKSI